MNKIMLVMLSALALVGCGNEATAPMVDGGTPIQVSEYDGTTAMMKVVAADSVDSNGVIYVSEGTEITYSVRNIGTDAIDSMLVVADSGANVVPTAISIGFNGNGIIEVLPVSENEYFDLVLPTPDSLNKGLDTIIVSFNGSTADTNFVVEYPVQVFNFYGDLSRSVDSTTWTQTITNTGSCVVYLTYNDNIDTLFVNSTHDYDGNEFGLTRAPSVSYESKCKFADNSYIDSTNNQFKLTAF